MSDQDEKNDQPEKTQYVSYSYDIPKHVKPSEYPKTGETLRRFAVRVQQSVWYMPISQFHRTTELSAEIKAVGGNVDHFRFDTRDSEAIYAKSRTCLASEVEGIHKYIEASIESTAKKLAEAKRLLSIDETNKAIRFQQTALNRALQELVDAEECSVAFDLSGDTKELIKSVRSAVMARSDAFVAEKTAARALVKAASGTEGTDAGETDEVDDADPAALGFGIDTAPTTTPGTPGTGTAGA